MEKGTSLADPKQEHEKAEIEERWPAAARSHGERGGIPRAPAALVVVDDPEKHE